MTDLPNSERSPDLWQPINLSLIIFPEDPDIGLKKDWWEDVTGGECESIRKGLERIDHGPFSNNSLKLEITPIKTTWTVGPLVDANEPKEEWINSIPTLGQFTESCISFCDLMDRWISDHCPEIKRIAFAGKMVRPTESKEAAYKTLNEYLPGFHLDVNTSEFEYRINRPRDSKVIPGLLLNRLCTWSAVQFAMQIQVETGGDSRRIPGDSSFCGLLRFDLNTDAERKKPIPKEKVSLLFQELRELANEIAISGDIP